MDITVVRVDVDSEFLERALRAVPGVAPAGDGEVRTAAERDRDGDRGPGEEWKSGEVPPGGERSTERVGETPPPAGAPAPTREENGESGGRNWRRTLLAAGAALTGVGALVGLAALLWRRRRRGEEEEGEETAEPATESPARERPDRTVDRAPLVGLGFLVATALVQRLLARRRDGSEAAASSVSSQPRP